MNDLDFNKNIKQAITAEERKRLKSDLQSLEASLYTSKNSKTNWLMVASISLLLSLGGYFYVFNQSVSPEKLYAQNFEPYRNVVQPIVRGEESNDKKTIAFSYYEQKNYKKAIELFNDLSSKKILDNNTLSFYKANAFLELKQPQKAIDLLMPLTENSNSKWQKESLWYLALASLQKEDVESAKKYLLELKNTSNFKTEAVNELLTELK